MIIGLDECGVGCLFGDLVACACVLADSVDTTPLRDSKKLTLIKRKKMYEMLVKNENVKYGLGILTNKEIDNFGMAICRRLIFTRALEALEKSYKITSQDKIIVDGTLFDAYRDIPFECIPKADDIYAPVSAASILAKHYRDTQILDFCAQHPVIAQKYDLASNKGYPSPKHMSAVSEYGVTSYHRLSFAPCTNAFQKFGALNDVISEIVNTTLVHPI